MTIHRNWIILAIAIVFGLGSAMIAMRYLDQRVADLERRTQSPMAKAVVAKYNLPKGEALTYENVAVRDIPAEWLHSGAITPEQFERAASAALAFPAVQGEPLLWSQLEGERAPTFSARLAPGRRAITIPVDEINSISGLLELGDSIDLLATVRRGDRDISFLLLQAVKVLATGTHTTEAVNRQGHSQQHYSTITLDVTPDEVRRILAARTVGKITAVLRAPGDTGTTPKKYADAIALLGLNEPAAAVTSSVPVIYGGTGNPLNDIPRLPPPVARIATEAQSVPNLNQ